jgi:hypothetical protein
MKRQNVLKLILAVAVLAFALGNLTGTKAPQLSLVPTAHAQGPTQKANIISRYRQAARDLITVESTLRNLRREYDSLNYGALLVDGDFANGNAGITAAQFVDGVGAIDPVLTTLNTNRTNLFRLAN